MPPIFLLLILCGVTAAALSAARLHQQRERIALQKLAVEHRLHFSRGDQLRLTPRVAGVLPVPGAAGVLVSNVVYGSAAGVHRYVFTVEYTIGVMRTRQRVRRAATFSEPRDRGGGGPCRVAMTLAPVELELLDQYRLLLNP
jgi:hypothetical protein